MTLGGRIRKRRKELGLSQKDLAEGAGLSLRTVQRIENDQNSPRGWTLRAIAEVLETESIALVQEKPVDQHLDRLLFINLSVLSFLIMPFGNLVFPILAWSKFSYYKEVHEVGKRIINRQLTWALITFPLLAIAPFADGYVPINFPLIFIVLIGAYAFNVFTVLLTAQRLRAGNYQVCNRSIRFL